MSKSAQLAQGSKIYIAGSSGTPESLTAVTIGYPTILAMTGHTGLSNGDVVVLSGFTDTASVLNGKTTVVTHKATGVTNDTFAVDINSVGAKISIGSGIATPADWTQIKEIKDIKPAGAQATKIDVTDLDSAAKEFEAGLVDNGAVTMSYYEKIDDPGQIAALAAFNAGTTFSFKVALTGGSVRTFDATVLKFGTLPDAAVDGVQTGTFEIQISGAVTRS
jgi:hypothetical protein